MTAQFEYSEMTKRVKEFGLNGMPIPDIAKRLGISVEEARAQLCYLYSRVFDASNKHWSARPSYNEMFLAAQQNYLNDRLRAYGHVFLNEVYDMLGFERSKAGAVMGWFNEEGTEPIEFEIVDDTPDGGFIINFNVHGVIYDKLPKV